MTQEPEPGRRKRLPVRWLTLAEIVGLGALVVAGLGYWDSHRERIQQDRDRAAAEREQTAAANQRSRAEVQAAQREAVSHALLLTGTPNGAELRLKPARADQVIQNQTLWFPTEVRADSVSTTGNPRIEAGWIEDRLRRVAKQSDRRLPVAIETSFIEDGETRTDRSLYLVGFSLHGRLVGGPRVEFEGLSLAKRGVSGDLQAAANGYWIGRR